MDEKEKEAEAFLDKMWEPNEHFLRKRDRRFTPLLGLLFDAPSKPRMTHDEFKKLFLLKHPLSPLEVRVSCINKFQDRSASLLLHKFDYILSDEDTLESKFTRIRIR